MSSHILDLSPSVPPGSPEALAHYRAAQRAGRQGSGKPDLARALGGLLVAWEQYAKVKGATLTWVGLGDQLRALVTSDDAAAAAGFDRLSLDANIRACAAEYGATLHEVGHWSMDLRPRDAMAIHHIDGDPTNNDPANLRLVDMGKP